MGKANADVFGYNWTYWFWCCLLFFEGQNKMNDFGIKPIKINTNFFKNETKISGFSQEKKGLKRKTFTDDFYKLMDEQNKLCADPLCSKRHGKRQSVSTTRDLDHKFPIKLWDLMNKKGDHNDISNLQLLCPDCHRIKTASDRKKIAIYKTKKLKTRGQGSGSFGLTPQFKMPKLDLGF